MTVKDVSIPQVSDTPLEGRIMCGALQLQRENSRLML